MVPNIKTYGPPINMEKKLHELFGLTNISTISHSRIHMHIQRIGEKEKKIIISIHPSKKTSKYLKSLKLINKPPPRNLIPISRKIFPKKIRPSPKTGELKSSSQNST
jgi:hypothetical protein